MPRSARIVIPGLPHHITQRGNDRQDVFFTPENRKHYLFLLRGQCESYGLDVVGYCLMTNHIHIIAIPRAKFSIAKAIGVTHSQYSQYINDVVGRIGHLWHSRFYSCTMDDEHYVLGTRYVDCNPQRAGLVVDACEYPWSSAAAHCGGGDPTGLLRMNLWHQDPQRWRAFLQEETSDVFVEQFRKRTLTGHPLGSEQFIDALEAELGRRLRPAPRGRRPLKSSRQLPRLS